MHRFSMKSLNLAKETDNCLSVSFFYNFRIAPYKGEN